MHGSGLQVDDALRSSFASAANKSDTLFLKYQISKSNDCFVLKSEGKIDSSSSSPSLSNDFKKFQSVLDDKEPCFIVTRLQSEEFNKENKWLLIFYMPDGANVKDRMVYASSLAALRQGLGNGNFLLLPFNIQSKSACTYEEYYHSIILNNNHEHSITNEEKIRKDNELASHMMMADVKISAIVGLPIKASEDAIDAMKLISNNASSSSSSSSAGHTADFSSIIFYLHPGTEVLLVEKKGNYLLDDIHQYLPNDEPRYVLQYFPHTNPNDSSQSNIYLFIYYCPQNIKPKLKMFYSTCKAVVIKMAEQFGIKIHRSLEISDKNDLSLDNTMNDLYPPIETKNTFKKPVKQGRGKARLITQ